MDFLATALAQHGYTKVRFKISRTNHLLINVKVNGVKGTFILDTGASSTCIGFQSEEKFLMRSVPSPTLAAGAGTVGLHTRMALFNVVSLGRFKINELPITLFDLSHVNQALEQQRARPVDGIIGADILLLGHGIIDYYNRLLYLKRDF